MTSVNDLSKDVLILMERIFDRMAELEHRHFWNEKILRTLLDRRPTKDYEWNCVEKMFLNPPERDDERKRRADLPDIKSESDT